MILQKAKISQLIPIEHRLRSSDLKVILSDFNPKKFDPISVLETSEGFILGDGHHRAFVIHQANSFYGLDLNVPIRICETDEEITRYFKYNPKVKSRVEALERIKICREWESRVGDYTCPTNVGKIPIDLMPCFMKDKPYKLIHEELSLINGYLSVSGRGILGKMPSLDALRKIGF